MNRSLANVITASLAVVPAAQVVHARQPDAALEQAVARLTAAKSELTRATPDGVVAAEHAVEAALRELIELAPNDRRAAMWMLDLAELKLTALARSCDDASVLFGIATAEQVRRVGAAAEEALSLAGRAETAATTAVEALEARLLEPGRDASETAAIARQVEPALAQLVEVELAVRIPALRMHATALQAAADADKPSGQSKLSEAVRTVAGAQATAGSVAAEIRKRLLLAGMLLRSVDAAQRASARRQVEWVLSTLAGGREREIVLSPGERVRVHMAAIRTGIARTEAMGPCPGEGKDWLVDLLLAEAGAAAANWSVATTAAGQEARVAAIGQLLRVARTYGGGDDALDSTVEIMPVRAAVYERVAAATNAGAAWAMLEPEAALARAWHLRRTSADKRLNAEATGLLARVIERADAPAAMRARALWMLAGGSEEANVGFGAGGRGHALRLVREFPESRLAEAAAARIVASWYERTRPRRPCDLRWSGAEEFNAVRDALPVLLRGRDADDPLHAVWVGVLVDAEGQPGAAELRRAAEAMRALPASSELRPELAACMTAAIERELGRARAAAQRDAVLAFAAEWFETDGAEAERAARLRLERAECGLESRELSAAEIVADLRKLLDSSLDQRGTVTRARLRVALGRAQRAAGVAAEAAATLRAVAEEFEADARATEAARQGAREAFWSAWAELLEMVRAGDGSDMTDRESQAQRLRERLEIIDPELGGEPWASRIRGK